MPTRLYDQNSLVEGQWNAICDVCGFKYKSGDLKKRWDGLMCCKEDWEIRQPLDFVRGVPDNQSVPWTRPDSNQDTDTITVDGSSLNTDILPDTIGDTDKTLRVDGTPRMNSIQEWNVDLTADRTATLDTTDVREGDIFTIYRTGGGAFDLIIGSVQTTSIPSVTKVRYNGSSWALYSYTPLGI